MDELTNILLTYSGIDIICITETHLNKSALNAEISIDGYPDLLPSNFSSSTLHSLVTFCLDNSYFKYNGNFYSQNSDGTMGSPLVVELAEIKVTKIQETALNTYSDPTSTYRHFVDDRIGDFRDRSHVEEFLPYLNSLSGDLIYTIEHRSTDGSLPSWMS